MSLSHTIAHNANAVAGKWVPYYYKPFRLGKVDSGEGSTDGGVYITQTVGGTDGVFSEGVCMSSHNCGYYYEIIVQDTTSDAFSVTKFNLDGSVDTVLVASDISSTEYKWDLGLTNSWITIDIGVMVRIGSLGASEVNDRYRIHLPTADEMIRRRIYHGGYSSFLRMAYAENISFNSDIIPTNLKGKNISISFNPPITPQKTLGEHGGLNLAQSIESAGGNYAVSLSMCWNVDKDGAHATTATDALYAWISGETWAYGTGTHYDLTTLGNVGASADFPVHVHIPESDVAFDNTTTGTLQRLNASVSGRAGYAKMRTEFMQGAGAGQITAFNQFWPCILTIS